jgi:hypothetical protein
MVARISRAVLLGIAVLTLIGAMGCNQLKKLNVPCNIAGIVINELGQPQGYITVQLILKEDGRVAQQMTTEDAGNFMFSKIDPGLYQVKVLGMGQAELPTTENIEVDALPGKTYDIKVIVKKPEK